MDKRVPDRAPGTRLPLHAPRLRIGLFGGSFNPRHAAHRAASLFALRRLGLDRVWWLVTPGNPLKDTGGLPALEQRLAAARALADHPRIDVTDIEARFGTRYSVDTLRFLKRRYPLVRFVWLMGADNLAQLPRWRHWRRIVESCAIAVFERHPYSHGALAGPAARGFAGARLPERRAAELPAAEPPAWVFVRLRPHPASATAIRSRAAVAAAG